MARTLTYGLENNSVTNNLEFNANAGSPTISSATKYSGSYSLRISSLVSATIQAAGGTLYNTNTNTAVFARAYFNFATLPSAENAIFTITDSSNNKRIYCTVDANGAITL